MAQRKTAAKRGRKAASPAPAAKRRGPSKGFKKATTAQTIQMHDLLKANFNKEAGKFENGYSDARIAEEVGVPHEAFVARMRRDMFGSKIRVGKPKVDEQLGEIRDLLTKVAGTVSSLEGRIGALEAGNSDRPSNLPSANQAPTKQAA